jgi:hypothetical protein
MGNGNFSEEALSAYTRLVTEHKGVDFAENEVYDFARCVRPDGTAYGTKGKCRKGTEEAKEKVDKTAQEKKGYKPRGRGEAKNLIQGELGKKRKNDVSIGFANKNEIENAYEIKISIAESRLKGEELEKRKKELDQWKQQKLASYDKNKKFAEDLKREMPSNVLLTSDSSMGEVVMKTLVGKNRVEVTFSPNQGFNYRVNGRLDKGTVKDRKEQLKVAQTVRQMWDATVRAAPEGTVFKTSAHDGDGSGAARQKAYQRVGFGAPQQKRGFMYAIKRNGQLEPLEATEGEEKAKANIIDFREKSTDSVWVEILFPGSGLQK